MNRRIWVKLILWGAIVVSPLTWAGSNGNQKATIEPERIVKFAKSVEKYAAAKGARAFIIARAGRPQKELPRGIQYTHTAVAVYSNIELSDGTQAQGYAIHNLYQENNKPERSVLMVDYPVDFFWGVHSLKAGIIIPSADIQQRLIQLISDGKNADIHNPKYSVIANPFNAQYQNCTEHTLDLLNAAIYQTTDKNRLKANAKAYFKPQRVNMSPFKLMMGAAFMGEVTTKDHRGRVYTTTFASIGRYLSAYQLADQMVTLYEDGGVTIL